MSEVSENSEKPSRGEAAPGLSAQLPQDIEIGPILVPKWLQNWSQNGVRKGLKFALVFWAAFWAQIGPKNGPKKAPKLVPKWGQLPRCAPGAPSGPQNGPKMAPESQNGPKMAPKWLQNVTFGSGLPLIHGTWQAQAECA